MKDEIDKKLARLQVKLKKGEALTKEDHAFLFALNLLKRKDG